MFGCLIISQRKTMPMVAPQQAITSTPEVLYRIRTVIAECNTPSWLRSVPVNFGDTRAGTVKADEWRTLATVYIPLALVSLWGKGSHH